MDPFATLGLARKYELDTDELERKYRDLQRALHPDRHTGAPASERRMKLQKAVEVNEAYRTLRDDQRRAEALLAVLSGGAQPAAHDRGDPELLLEMMELRESLSEAKAARDAVEVERLASRVKAEQAQVRAELAQVFDSLPDSAPAQALVPARALVSRLKYFQRFLDEVAVFEDEALP